jgi:iron only hydrogenase large subunit-like protein
VLLESQSCAALATALADPSLAVVVSISPAARSAAAAALGLSAEGAARALSALFRGLGCAAVLDASVGAELTLLEAGAEFVARLRGEAGAGPLPLLASSCPAWVCLAEKDARRAEALVAHLSRVKSPMAVQGALAKRLLPALTGNGTGMEAQQQRRVFHAAVMPCYDKKLEASRSQLRGRDALDGAESPDTDVVLTTGEVVSELLAAQSLDAAALAASPQGELDPAWHAAIGPAGPLWRAPGGGAGGLAEAAAFAAAWALWGVQLPPEPLPWRARRNADFREVEIAPPAGAPAGARPLRLAAVYGLRNITTLLRQLAAGDCPYDYVEVMACPGGCLNGGGQPTASGRGAARTGALAAVEAVHATVAPRPPGAHPMVARVYAALGEAAPGGLAARAALHTDFKALAPRADAANLNNW